MKKTLIALMAVAGMAVADTLLEIDFTSLGESSTDTDTPAGWTAGQWNGTNNTPYYIFGSTGAVVGQTWKQNYLTTELDLTSQGSHSISFTLYNNNTEDTGNMFFLSSDTYSIVIGNSYTSNSDIYVGTLNEAVGRDFVCFQTGTKINPTVLDNSSGLDVGGIISYHLAMKDGNMTIYANLSSTTYEDRGYWSTTITGMEDVTFNKLGFITDGDSRSAGVFGISVTTSQAPAPSVPEPTTAALSLLALAGLAARRRRK